MAVASKECTFCIFASCELLISENVMTYDIVDITCNAMDEVWLQFGG